jgi:membrane-bound ClpP family serine protease
MLTLGIVLLVVGIALLVTEAHLPTIGAVGAGGLAAVVAGGYLAITGSGGSLAVAVPAAIGAGAIGAGFLYVVVTKGVATQRARLRSGAESLVGHVGVLRSAPDPLGHVFVDGALWRARRSLIDGDEPESLRAGDQVVIEGIDGLTLDVRRAEEWEMRR